MEILLIPEVKSLRTLDAFLNDKNLVIPSLLPDPRLKLALGRLPQAEDGTVLEISICEDMKESYHLSVLPESVHIKACDCEGAFYAIQTLRQLYTMEKVPCVEIQDKPDFPYRGFYFDVSRGRVPKVAYIKKLIDNMAYYKLNSFQLYIELV